MFYFLLSSNESAAPNCLSGRPSPSFAHCPALGVDHSHPPAALTHSHAPHTLLPLSLVQRHDGGCCSTIQPRCSQRSDADLSERTRSRRTHSRSCPDQTRTHCQANIQLRRSHTQLTAMHAIGETGGCSTTPRIDRLSVGSQSALCSAHLLCVRSAPPPVSVRQPPSSRGTPRPHQHRQQRSWRDKLRPQLQ